MADGTIRVGVVGLGSFGKHHVRHYAANPAARLVAVVDVDGAQAAQFAAANNAAAFVDHHDLIGKVDAVSIAVPASAHYAVARDLIEAGIHVLIEKPIATDSAAARELTAAAGRKHVILQVGHVERFSPAVAELRRRVVNPRRISAIRRTRRSGRSADVDVVLDLMIHDIDLILTLAGAPVASVAASGADAKTGATDEAEAWLTFGNGLIATLSASRVAEENERKLTVTEPDTQFTADLSVPSLTVLSRRRPGAAAEPVALTSHDNLGAEIDAFLTCVATGAEPDVDGRAGVAALEIAERIQAAIADVQPLARRSL